MIRLLVSQKNYLNMQIIEQIRNVYFFDMNLRSQLKNKLVSIVISSLQFLK